MTALGRRRLRSPFNVVQPLEPAGFGAQPCHFPAGDAPPGCPVAHPRPVAPPTLGRAAQRSPGSTCRRGASSTPRVSPSLRGRPRFPSGAPLGGPGLGCDPAMGSSWPGLTRAHGARWSPEHFFGSCAARGPRPKATSVRPGGGGGAAAATGLFPWLPAPALTPFLHVSSHSCWQRRSLASCWKIFGLWAASFAPPGGSHMRPTPRGWV